MSEIRVLDKKIAELIAAGEVIERPASIVKELLENSIDAGARHITVEIKRGGIEMIRVTDDGKGISPEDAPTAFLRHATSKVKTAEDLNSIYTLGFRGEALASVCAISKVSLLTRVCDSEFGCHIEIAGGEIISNDRAGCPEGTTIIVKDVFYNTPARMKFLKKDVSEANAIAAVVEKIAVSNPKISFQFIREGRLELQTAGDGKLSSSIYSVFGRSFSNDLLEVNQNKNGVSVTGYITKALNAKSKRSMQYFFLNGRTVRSATMTVALEEAYKGSIMVGKFPACVLMVEVSPSIVDVNVHPAKTEVRFSDEHLIYDAVYFACKTALGKDGAEAQINFKQNNTPFSMPNIVKSDSFTEGNQIKIDTFEPKKETKSETENKQKEDTSYLTQKIKYDPPRPIIVTFCDPAGNENKTDTVSDKTEISEKNYPDSVIEKQKEETLRENKSAEENKPIQNDRFNGAKIVGELFGTYILLECDNALYLVDKHAAHERLLYNKIKEENGIARRQYLLEPRVIKLSRDEYDAVISHSDTVCELGFETEDFGDGTLIVRSVPASIASEDVADVLSEIASDLKSCKKEIIPQVLDDLYHTIACRSAIKAHDKSSVNELSFLIECLREDTDVKYCPHGRPVTAKISKTEIEKKFGRIQ